jgi:hypothetical protein
MPDIGDSPNPAIRDQKNGRTLALGFVARLNVGLYRGGKLLDLSGSEGARSTQAFASDGLDLLGGYGRWNYWFAFHGFIFLGTHKLLGGL